MSACGLIMKPCFEVKETGFKRLIRVLRQGVITYIFLPLYKRFIHNRCINNEILKHVIKDEFNKIYWYSYRETWKNTYWLGVQTEKCPTDLWIYQEIIQDLKPDVIIEAGTFLGGSALYLASICELVGNGKVISIDIAEQEGLPRHSRITYLMGSSVSDDIISKVRGMITQHDKVMVILDSAHEKDHVLKELIIYSKFVTKGSYIIVEDTNINGNPIRPGYGPGPMEAVRDFLGNNNSFVIDRSMEKFYLSFNPDGYLKKVKL